MMSGVGQRNNEATGTRFERARNFASLDTLDIGGTGSCSHGSCFGSFGSHERTLTVFRQEPKAQKSCAAFRSGAVSSEPFALPSRSLWTLFPSPEAHTTGVQVVSTCADRAGRLGVPNPSVRGVGTESSCKRNIGAVLACPSRHTDPHLRTAFTIRQFGSPLTSDLAALLEFCPEGAPFSDQCEVLLATVGLRTNPRRSHRCRSQAHQRHGRKTTSGGGALSEKRHLTQKENDSVKSNL